MAAASTAFCWAAHPFRLIYTLYTFLCCMHIYICKFMLAHLCLFRVTFIHSFIHPFIGLTGGMLRRQKPSEVNLEAR